MAGVNNIGTSRSSRGARGAHATPTRLHSTEKRDGEGEDEEEEDEDSEYDDEKHSATEEDGDIKYDEKHNIYEDDDDLSDSANKNDNGSSPPGKNITVVFIIGGPGSGKGTLCAAIGKQFGFTHLSAGDLLREEAKSNSEQGTMINNIMHEGKLVPSEIIVKLLLKAMMKSRNNKFVVDGFPRSKENCQAYERIAKLAAMFDHLIWRLIWTCIRKR